MNLKNDCSSSQFVCRMETTSCHVLIAMANRASFLNLGARFKEAFFFPLAGSPWKIEVRNPANVTVDTRAIQLVPVGVLSEFEVHTGTVYGDITVNITGELDIISVKVSGLKPSVDLCFVIPANEDG